MKSLYFVRHGQSEWNATGRMQGQMNSDLSALGREQADAHGRLLATHGVDAIYSSPLDRARQTADVIRRYVRLDVSCDSRLKEWNCGDWSGHLYEDVKRNWPVEWAALEADRFHYRGPNCENYPDMIARVSPFIDEILSGDSRRIAIVSHGLIGRVMVGILMRHGEAEMLTYRQPNDVVYVVHTGTTRLEQAKVQHYVAGHGPIDGLVVLD